MYFIQAERAAGTKARGENDITFRAHESEALLVSSMSRFLYKSYSTTVNVRLGRSPMEMANRRKPLIFEVLAECKTTKARTGRMTLVHHHVDTPVFMPVGTQVYKAFSLLA